MSRELSVEAREAIAARVRTRVETLTRVYPSRNGVAPHRLNATSEYIEAEFRRMGFAVQSQHFAVGRESFRNVFVELPGLSDSSMIIIGAHYDTVIGTPGADDNASGVAALFELAALLKDTSRERTLMLIAYANEEPPYFHSMHMGSRHHARSVKRAQRTIGLMIALEMIGYAGETIPQMYPFPGMRLLGQYPAKGTFIGVVGNLRSRRHTRVVRDAMRAATTIEVESLVAPGFLPPLFLSDHASYWQEGFPAVMMTDTAFLRNPHYHRPSDTAETLNYRFLAEVICGVFAAVLALDHADGV
ncbi:MAG: peptidase M28 [Ignavibacteria bacterium]